MTVKDFLKGELIYHENSQMILIEKPEGNHEVVLDVRGWSEIKKHFKNNKDAVLFQDQFGYWVADVINKALEAEEEII